MKPDLAEKLMCIKCGASDFELVAVKKSGEHVEEGLLVCRKCGYAYAIIEGIVRTLDDRTRREAVEKYREFVPARLREKVH